VDETYVKVAGQWRYVYRAIDQTGQVIDVFVLAAGRQRSSPVLPAGDRRDQGRARRGHHRQGAGLPGRAGGAAAAAWHRTEQYANNRVEADHGRLKARLRPMRGLKQDRSTRVLIAGHAFVQNVRRGHCELAVDEPVTRRLAIAFEKLALAI
jgi:transposase, IS6 family